MSIGFLFFKTSPALLLKTSNKYFHKKSINKLSQMVDYKQEITSLIYGKHISLDWDTYKNAKHILCIVIFELHVPSATFFFLIYLETWQSPEGNLIGVLLPLMPFMICSYHVSRSQLDVTSSCMDTNPMYDGLEKTKRILVMCFLHPLSLGKITKHS